MPARSASGLSPACRAARAALPGLRDPRVAPLWHAMIRMVTIPPIRLSCHSTLSKRLIRRFLTHVKPRYACLGARPDPRGSDAAAADNSVRGGDHVDAAKVRAWSQSAAPGRSSRRPGSGDSQSRSPSGLAAGLGRRGLLVSEIAASFRDAVEKAPFLSKNACFLRLFTLSRQKDASDSTRCTPAPIHLARRAGRATGTGGIPSPA